MTHHMPFTSVIFDLDGTLIHSAPDIHAATAQMLAEIDRPTLDLETIISMIGRGIEVLLARALTATGGRPAPDEEAKILSRFRVIYNSRLTVLTRAYDGVPEMLEQLAAAGVRLGLCTNKPEAPAREAMQALDLMRHFPVVVGGDTLSVKKPDAAPLLHCMTLMSADPARTLYVGDSETDYRTARNAGLPIAYFTGGYQVTPIAGYAPEFELARTADVTRHILF